MAAANTSKRPPLTDLDVVVPPNSSSWLQSDSSSDYQSDSSDSSRIRNGAHQPKPARRDDILQSKKGKFTALAVLKRILPFLAWLPKYQISWLRGDIIAGLTTAVLAIPQSMAYATVVGVSPVFGLYAASVPPIVYAIFGTSPQLAIAPVAVQCIILRSVLSFVDSTSEPERYTQLAILTSLLSGIFMFICGILRLGYVVTFFSPSVVKSFNAASGGVILISQLDSLFGFSAKRSEHAIVQLINVITGIGNTNWAAFLLGACGIAILVTMQKIAPRFPSALIVTAVGAVAAYLLFSYSDVEVPVVGVVPAGMPIPRITTFTLKDVRDVLPGAVIVGLVGFMSAVAVTEKYAEVFQYSVDPNQELIAFGLTHVIGWFFSAIDAFAGLARTVVNVEAGARTQIAGFTTGVTILLTLQCLTSALYYIPKSILSAVIISAGYQLINPMPFVELYQMKKQDFAVAIVTMGVTLFATVQLGLFIGIAFSLFMIVYRSAHPHWAILGELNYKPGTFKSVHRYRGARQYDGILIFRFDASLFFANFAFFQDTVIEQIEKRGHIETDLDAEDTEQAAEYERSRGDLEENRPLMQGRDRVPHSPVKFIVFDFNPVNDLDVSACQGIIRLQRRLCEQYSVRVLFAGVKGPVRDTLWRVTGGMQGLDRSRTRAVHFLELDDAAAIRRLQTPVASPRPENRNGEATTLFSQFPVDATISSPFTPHAHSSPRLAGVVGSPTQEYIDCACNGQLHRDQFFLTVQGAVAFARSVLVSSRAGGYGTL
ncbi:sulfate transporter family-domain-containing protein [Cladochytrium replicatum]|nr:sulfate transporter family-domain-containing protein [Cladochytrium replicatum]